MKIPRKLKILGLNWQVVYDDEYCTEREIFGATDHFNQEIKLLGTVTKQLQEQTFLHELMHAVFWSMGLRETYDRKTEERIVGELSTGLYQVMKENGLLSKR